MSGSASIAKSRAFGRQRTLPRHRCNLTPEARRKGGLASAKKRRAAAMAALDGMTKIEIAKRYYVRGWHQGVRTERRRQQGRAA